MHSTEQSLNNLLTYYERSRGCGHTSLLFSGAGNYDKEFILLADTIHSAKILFEQFKNAKPASFYSKLNSCKMPIAIDNSFMVVLLRDTLAYIEYLKKQSEGEMK